MASFRNIINRFSKARATPKSSIGQTINPDMPYMNAEDINYLAKAVKTVLTFGTTGGSIGSSMGPSGLQLRSGPTGGKSAVTGYFAVMRAFGTAEGPEAIDKLERFIQVQKIYPTTTEPWDHRWRIDPVETMVPVSCFPGLRAEHYAQYLTLADDFENDIVMLHTPVLDIQMRGGVWIALQAFKFDLSEDVGEFRITDCNRVQTV
jgi:hypothetical protein